MRGRMSAGLIQRLIEAGTPVALIAEVALLAARAETVAADAVAERRRARDRDYRRRVRAGDGTGEGDLFAAAADPADSVDSADSVDEAPSSPDKESGFPKPLPKEINPNSPAPAKGARKASRLDPGFVPHLAGQAAEMVERWPPGRLDREIAQFRDHFAKLPGARGLSMDWQASLRTWLRHADDRMKDRKDGSAGQPAIGRTASAAIAVFGAPGEAR